MANGRLTGAGATATGANCPLDILGALESGMKSYHTQQSIGEGVNHDVLTLLRYGGPLLMEGSVAYDNNINNNERVLIVSTTMTTVPSK